MTSSILIRRQFPMFADSRRSRSGSGRARPVQPVQRPVLHGRRRDDAAFKRLHRRSTSPARRAASCRSCSRTTSSRTRTTCSSRPTRSATDNWTTLPDSKATRPRHRASCSPAGRLGLASLHPFLTHYQTSTPVRHRRPTGTDGGAWNAATGNSGAGRTGASTCALRRQADRGLDHRRTDPGLARARRLGRRRQGHARRRHGRRDVVRGRQPRLDDRPAARGHRQPGERLGARQE